LFSLSTPLAFLWAFCFPGSPVLPSNDDREPEKESTGRDVLHLRNEKANLDAGSGQPTETKMETLKSFSEDGDYKRRVDKDGKPLSDTDRKKEQEKLRRV
jgi:hypothetical protein